MLLRADSIVSPLWLVIPLIISESLRLALSLNSLISAYKFSLQTFSTASGCDVFIRLDRTDIWVVSDETLSAIDFTISNN